MKTIAIVSNKDVGSHAKELEELIKIIDCTDEIVQLDYDEYFPLATDDRMFFVCPSNPVSDLLRVPAPAIKRNAIQVIPVTYLDSQERNLPSALKHTANLVISGHYFPSFTIDDLCRILNVPNRLDTNYIHPILRNKSLPKPLKGTILTTLSNLAAARRTTNTSALKYVQTLKNETLEAAKELKNVLASVSKSEQREIADILKNTPLGECLEKINLEKDQEAAAMVTTAFRP